MARPKNDINFQTVTVIPGSEIINRAYNATKQIEYLGHAIKGSANSDTNWTIRKYTYNTDKQVSSERIAHCVAWDDRATTVTYD